MTSAILYGLSTASTTLTTAATFASGTGGTGTTVSTQLLSGTGYYEMFGLGATGQSAVGSIPAPTGNGSLWDVTTLETNTLASGTYTFIVTPSVGSGSLSSCTFTIRAYKRSSGGVYTLIASGLTSSFAITTTPTAQSVTTSSVGSMGFVSGDKLYTDVWLNSAPASTRSVLIAVSSTSSGIANDTQITTPGYSPTGAGAVHLRLSDGGYGGVFS